MAMTKEEKNLIVDKVVAILKAPDKKERIDRLREKVLKEEDSSDTKETNYNDVVYSVVQAIEELYG
ncbi:MAG: hypothetical protein GF344_10400 [Chitinivibrionales bacterium]|nr:hypothetical protein [Chitinivibrionales bacterium]MBD3357235.1 hypothetical protein [Chitinivibrionales bacterium]